MTEQERIQKRAYELWEEAGKPNGQEDIFWGLATLQIWREDYYREKAEGTLNLRIGEDDEN